MSFLQLIDSTGRAIDAITATITTPFVGVWQADLALDTATAPSGRVMLSASSLGVEWSGTVIPKRSGQFVGMSGVRVIGGANGLSQVTSPHAWNGSAVAVTVKSVLLGLLTPVGETLSATSDAGVLGTALLGWAATARPTLRNLIWLLESAAPANTIYRTLRDGTIFVGPNVTAPSTVTYQVLERQPQESMVVLSDLSQWIQPGDVIAEGTVDHVILDTNPREIRARVWLQ